MPLRILLVTVLLTAACAASPTTPSPAPAPLGLTVQAVAGTWSGTQSIVRCDYPSCGVVNGPPVPTLTEPLRMTLSAAGFELSGALSGAWPHNGGPPLPITARIVDQRTVVLNGQATYQFSCFGGGPFFSEGRFVINDWTGVVEPATGQMAVTWSYTATKGLSSCYYTHLGVTATARLNRTAP